MILISALDASTLCASGATRRALDIGVLVLNGSLSTNERSLFALTTRAACSGHGIHASVQIDSADFAITATPLDTSPI